GALGLHRRRAAPLDEARQAIVAEAGLGGGGAEDQGKGQGEAHRPAPHGGAEGVGGATREGKSGGITLEGGQVGWAILPILRTPASQTEKGGVAPAFSIRPERFGSGFFFDDRNQMRDRVDHAA